MIRLIQALCATTLLFALALPLRAGEITWSPEIGYQSDEIELSGITPEESAKILDWMNEGRQAEEAGRDGKAKRRYKRVYKRFPKSQYAPEALHRTALIHLSKNKIDKAFDSLEAIAWNYPNYGSFNAILGRMYEIAVARLETYRPKLLGVIPGFLNRDRAIEYFERIVIIAPYSDYAPLSLMKVSKGHAKEGEDMLAIHALNRLVTNYPRSFITPDAYLELAKTHAGLIKGPKYDQGETKSAITYYKDFLAQYPQSQSVAEAEKGLTKTQNELAQSKITKGDFYYRHRNNYYAAKVFYNEAITIAPRSEAAEEARQRLEEVEKRLEKREVEAIAEKPQEAPSLEDMQRKAQQESRRKILGIF